MKTERPTERGEGINRDSIPEICQTFEQFQQDRPVLIRRKDVLSRINVIADNIYEDHLKNNPDGPAPTLIMLAKGAKPTVNKLRKALKNRGLKCDVVKVRAKSRKKGMEQEETLDVSPPIEQLVIREGSLPIFVDDVLDSGMTLSLLVSQFNDHFFGLPDNLKPKIAVLLEKVIKERKFEVKPDFVGFRIPYELHWVEGFGMDTYEKGRRKRDIIVRNDEMRKVLGDQFDIKVTELLESQQAA